MAKKITVGPALLALLFALLLGGWGQEVRPQPAPPGQPAFVIRALDGDTLLLANGERVRYIGVDAPELGDSPPWSDRAKAAKALNERLTRGKVVWLARDVSDRDRYGRLLRYAFVTDGRGRGWVFVNAELVRRGLARATPYPPDLRRASHFASLEREAQRARRGLWNRQRPCGEGGVRAGLPVLGNRRSRVYHLPCDRFYGRMRRSRHRVEFPSEAEALARGFRRSRR